MKKLIINADDFGLEKGINEGIIDAYKKGVVTSISIIAIAEYYNHALELLKKNNIKNIGAHIVVLDNEKDNSRYYRFPWKCFFGIIDTEKIYSKAKKQILTIKESGFNITHLDSHQHIHMIPKVLKVFIRLAREFNIDFIRFPYEAKVFNYLDIKGVFKTLLLRGMCLVSEKILTKSNIKYNDYFYGHFYSGKLNLDKLLKLIPYIKNGITELATHPGYISEELRKRYKWHINCENELLSLLDSRFQEAIKSSNIELISH